MGLFLGQNYQGRLLVLFFFSFQNISWEVRVYTQVLLQVPLCLLLFRWSWRDNKRIRKLSLSLLVSPSAEDSNLNIVTRMAKNLMTTNHLRHVEPVMSFPSGAGKIPNLNAVTLGKALATEKDHLIFPSHEFSRQALVPSPDKVMFFSSLSFWCFPILIHPCLLMSFFCDYSQYLEMYRKSVEDPARFWSEIASRYYWKQKWGRQVYLENLDVRNGPISIEVFHPPIISSSSWSVLFNLFCSTIVLYRSGSKAVSPTLPSIAWTEMWKPDLATKLPFIGKATSLDLMTL